MLPRLFRKNGVMMVGYRNIFSVLILCCLVSVGHALPDRFQFDRSGLLQRLAAGTFVAGGAGYLVYSSAQPGRLKEAKKECAVAALSGLAGLSYLWWARRNCISHDLNIRVFHPPGDQGSTRDLTLYLHGWKGRSDCSVGEHYSRPRMPGTIVSFDFPDARRGPSLLCDVRTVVQSDFGQENDALVAIKVLNDAAKAGSPERIFLHGRSRGGAAAVNMRTMLTAVARELPESAGWRVDLDKIGVSVDDCRSLLRKMERGACVLEYPSPGVQKLISYRYGLLSPLVKIGLFVFSKYKPWGLHPSESRLPLNRQLTLVLFQKNDAWVGNSEHNKQLIERLCAGGNCCCVLEGAHPDGHNTSGLKQFGAEVAKFLVECSGKSDWRSACSRG